eukprot:m.220834 g.220834  ORF g.220834 m.220834 type:complete len:438 (+) comp10468_c0_seq1:3274-4587(+)
MVMMYVPLALLLLTAGTCAQQAPVCADRPQAPTWQAGLQPGQPAMMSGQVSGTLPTSCAVASRAVLTASECEFYVRGDVSACFLVDEAGDVFAVDERGMLMFPAADQAEPEVFLSPSEYLNPGGNSPCDFVGPLGCYHIFLLGDSLGIALLTVPDGKIAFNVSVSAFIDGPGLHVTADYLYLPYNNSVYVYAADTGAFIAILPVSSAAPRSPLLAQSPSSVGPTVLIAINDSTIHAFSLPSGALLWTLTPGWPTMDRTTWITTLAHAVIISDINPTYSAVSSMLYLDYQSGTLLASVSVPADWTVESAPIAVLPNCSVLVNTPTVSIINLAPGGPPTIAPVPLPSAFNATTNSICAVDAAGTAIVIGIATASAAAAVAAIDTATGSTLWSVAIPNATNIACAPAGSCVVIEAQRSDGVASLYYLCDSGAPCPASLPL